MGRDRVDQMLPACHGGYVDDCRARRSAQEAVGVAAQKVHGVEVQAHDGGVFLLRRL